MQMAPPSSFIHCRTRIAPRTRMTRTVPEAVARPAAYSDACGEIDLVFSPLRAGRAWARPPVLSEIASSSKRVVKADHRRDTASKPGIVDWKQDVGRDQETLPGVDLDAGGAENRVERT